MNQTDLEDLLNDCPMLYHAGQQGSWPSIRDRGLLSTTALLDLYEINGEQRKSIEETRRATETSITHPVLPTAIIRDQLPMDDEGLRRCLPEQISPSEWYQTLNQKVFFWLSKGRLEKLLGAEAYHSKIHDIIEIDTRRLMAAYFDKIWLCPINSGYTKYMPAPRDFDTFKRINDYPYEFWRESRKRGERVVELAIDYAVPNIREFVTRVTERSATAQIRQIF